MGLAPAVCGRAARREPAGTSKHRRAHAAPLAQDRRASSLQSRHPPYPEWVQLMDDHAFLDRIISNPEDDTPRLIYADWLDEHGFGERAEFIRVQCQLAQKAKYDPAR